MTVKRQNCAGINANRVKSNRFSVCPVRRGSGRTSPVLVGHCDTWHNKYVSCPGVKDMEETASRAAPKLDPIELGESGSFTQIVELLGGRQVFKKRINSKLDAHEVIRKGIPGGALVSLVKHIKILDSEDLLQAVGVSRRTVQRRSDTPLKPLSQDQSGRAWKFAEIVTTATNVLGSQAEAEKWLVTPAVALNQRRPVDLLSSPAGTELVEQLLGRLRYGVYT